MSSRCTSLLFLPWLVWLCAATTGNWIAGSAGPPRPVRFSHAQHVPDTWLDLRTAEVFRDCRGCHRFGPDQPVSAPQRECGACHTGTGELQLVPRPGFENDLGGYRTRTRDAFRHHTHAMLECRECHLPRDNDNRVAGWIWDDFTIDTGPGQCARCHEQGRSAAAARDMRFFGGAAVPELAAALSLPGPHEPPAGEPARALLAERLVDVFAGPDGGINRVPLPVGGVFDHRDHIDPVTPGNGLACTVCHANIATAAADAVGTGAIPVEACARCHVRDAALQPARPAATAKREVRPSFALGAFAHRDHFDFLSRPAGQSPAAPVCNQQGYDDVRNRSCDACHAYAPPTPPSTGRDFPFEPGRSRHRYVDCIACHDVPAFQTGETAAEPLHGSTSADGRSGWGRTCTACHVFGDADMAATRPTVEVQRWTGRTFSFPAHTHPHITQRGIDRTGGPGLADCADCHRASVPELPSRLAQRVFRHDVHLPAQPTSDDCNGCHRSGAFAPTNAELGGADFRTYSLASCGDCHWGGEVVELLADGEQPPARAVVSFPHGPHVSGRGLACAECHALGADGAGVTTLPDALSCAKCHDHDYRGEGDSRYEGLFDGRAQSCARCHHDPGDTRRPRPAAAVPPIRGSAAALGDRRYQRDQDLFSGFADAQFHPLGGACTDCHRANLATDSGGVTALQPIRLVVDDHVAATRPRSFHELQGPSAPHDCLRCHWKPVGKWLDAVSGSRPPADEPPEWRQLRLDLARRPQLTREQVGNLFEGYPGKGRG